MPAPSFCEVREFHTTISTDSDGMLWAEVVELPGCLASGATMGELRAALSEAVAMHLPDDRSYAITFIRQ